LFSDARVMVGVPCHGMMAPDTCFALLKLQLFDFGANRMIRAFKNNSMSIVSWARNGLAKAFMEQQDAAGKYCTHLLFVDADMVFPSDGLLKLVECDADIAAGLFTNRSLPPLPVMQRLVEGKLEPVPLSELPADEAGLAEADPLEVDATGLAFTLVKRGVFEEMERPWFRHDFIPGQEPEQYGEDISFCLGARKLGCKIVVRPDVVVQHLGQLPCDIRHAWEAQEPEGEEEQGNDGAGSS